MVIYRLIQNGLVVAEVDCNSEVAAKREIMHYAMMYSQDGPVLIMKIK